MKKQILAVAVAGAFAVPAFAAADTSVTLFGQLQTQIVHHSGDSFENNGFRMHDAGGAGNAGDGANPNRIGVMVNHDLGNGLTALAKIEQNVTTTDGFNSGARDQYVGLDGNFGRVMAGRMTSPYATAGKDPLNATFMQARTAGGRLGPMGGFGNGSYLDRVLAYSNDFGPVSFTGAAILDNSDHSDTGYAMRLGFDAGPVEVYGAYQRADDHEQANAQFGNSIQVPGFVNDLADLAGVDIPSLEFSTASKVQTAKIGADWSTGPFRLVAEVEDYRIETDPTAMGESLGMESTESKGNTYFLSGTYTMGRNDFVLNLGHTNRDNAGNVDYAALGIKHNFSNRVMAYAGVSYSKDKAPADDVSNTAVGGGMRVSF
ncbi:porin [Thioalkalivibrio sp. AKL10]|uniref:porin n=1 Tax=Thioalkalivibrio sp. AKL10 TaxID=1158158 RepID=UPI0003733C97|nr:porin [Thioalkalivibrio sp. AKL10]